jgi:hypothetical protein
MKYFSFLLMKQEKFYGKAPGFDEIIDVVRRFKIPSIRDNPQLRYSEHSSFIVYICP